MTLDVLMKVEQPGLERPFLTLKSRSWSSIWRSCGCCRRAEDIHGNASSASQPIRAGVSSGFTLVSGRKRKTNLVRGEHHAASSPAVIQWSHFSFFSPTHTATAHRNSRDWVWPCNTCTDATVFRTRGDCMMTSLLVICI